MDIKDVTWANGDVITADKLNAITDEIKGPTYTTEAEVTEEITAIGANATGGKMTTLEVSGNSVTAESINGNFADGITGWGILDSTLSASNNILSVTGTGTGATVRTTRDTGLKPQIGEKAYFRLRARVTNSSCTQIRILIRDGSAGTIIVNTAQSTPVINTWYEFSFLATVASTLTNNLNIIIDHIYADAATANTKVMEVQEIMLVDTATNSEFASLTADEINARIPNWFEGTKHTNKMRVLSESKNLYQYGDIDVTTDIISSAVASFKGYVKALPSTQYTISSEKLDNIAWNSNDRLVVLELSQNYGVNSFTNILTYSLQLTSISSADAGTTRRYQTITTTSTTKYFAVFGYSQSGNTAIYTNIMLAKGTDTTYVPYFNTQGICPVELRSVPAIADTFNFVTGKHTQNIDVHTLVAGDITALTTTLTNVDYVTIPETTFVGVKTFVIAPQGILRPSLFVNEISSAAATVDQATSIGSHATFAGNLVFIVVKGTYADLAAAKTALAGTVVQYQLATPIETYYPASIVNAEPSGRFIQEAFVEDIAQYSSGITVDANYPIDNIAYIKKVDFTEFGKLTDIGLATHTIASGGGSYTDTSLTDGDWIVTGYRCADLSTLGTIDYSHGTNRDAQINDLTDDVAMLSKQHSITRQMLDFINNKVDTLDARTSNIDNYATASQAEAEAGTASNKFMTPERTKQAISAQADWQIISRTTLGSDVEQIDFTSISSDYKNLKIVFNLRSNTGARDLTLRFNDDGAVNYRYQQLKNTGTTVTTVVGTGASGILLSAAASNQIGVSYAFGNIDISNFNATKTKAVISNYYSEASGTPSNYFVNGVWTNITAKINKISLIASGTTIESGSEITLMGVK